MQISKTIALVFLLMALLIASPSNISAHPTSVGNTLIHIKPDTAEIDVLATIKGEDIGEYLKLDRDGNNIPDVDEIKAASDTIFSYMSERIAVTNNGEPCPVTEQRFVPDTTGQNRISLMVAVRCTKPLETVALSNRILFEDTGGHRHYARIQLGDSVKTTTFAPEFPTYTLEVGATATSEGKSAEASWASVVVQYTWEGFLHILIGLDHVLFVLCLLLLARKGKKLLLVITAFTLGHSVTLALSALNILVIPAGVIEPIIALSILVIAIENIIISRQDIEKEPNHRYILTALFGLIHGFGFSYVLRDEVGLPTDALLPALLTFNLGVELGQLAIVAVCWPLLRLAMKSDRYRYVVWGLSGVVGALALWWCIERTVFA